MQFEEIKHGKSVAALLPNYAFLMEYQYRRVVSCGTFPYFKQTARSRSDNSWVHNSRHAMRLLLLPLSTPNFKHSSCWAHNRPKCLHPLSYRSQHKSTLYLHWHFSNFSGVSLSLGKNHRENSNTPTLLSRFPVHPKKQ